MARVKGRRTRENELGKPAKQLIEMNTKMNTKLTNHFAITSRHTKTIVQQPSSISNVMMNKDLLIIHDHGYAKLRHRLTTPPKPDKKPEDPSKILTPSTCMSKLTISSQPTTTGKSVARRRLKAPVQNKQLTDYFPVRRSVRKCHSKILKEKRSEFEDAIVAGKEDGLRVESFVDKGRGVTATKNFRRGEFVVEYTGELIELMEARRRERLYATDENTGCYMYYFTLNCKQYCIDATAETKHLGRLINHSRQGNLITKPFMVDDVPHLILIAKRDIQTGEELLYDYGDRSKASILFYPWLAT